jgi:hypothetical protein
MVGRTRSWSSQPPASMLQRDEKAIRAQFLTRVFPWRALRDLQDSKLPSLFPRKFYLDLVDDDWIADTLSDDGACERHLVAYSRGMKEFTNALDAWSTVEIDIPPGMDIDLHAAESPSGESVVNVLEAIKEHSG